MFVAAGLLLGTGFARAQGDDWDRAEDTGAVEGPEPPAPEPAEPEADEAPEAEADGVEDEEMGPRLIGWVEGGLFVGTYTTLATTIDGASLSPMIGAAYAITPEIRVGAQMGLALVIHSEVVGPATTEPGGTAFRFGNPMVSGEWLIERSGRTRYSLGAGITLPVASEGSLSESFALQLAMGSRAAWDLWLWAPSRMSGVVSGRLDHDLNDQLTVGADAAVAVLFYTGDGRGDTVAGGQASANIDYFLGSFVLGARLSLVLAGEGLLPDRKEVELAFMPHARVALTEETFLSAAFVLNITSPYGFSFSDGKIWGVRVGFGAVL